MVDLASMFGRKRPPKLVHYRGALSPLSPGTIHFFRACLSRRRKGECPVPTHPTMLVVYCGVCGPEPKLQAISVHVQVL